METRQFRCDVCEMELDIHQKGKRGTGSWETVHVNIIPERVEHEKRYFSFDVCWDCSEPGSGYGHNFNFFTAVKKALNSSKQK